MVRKRDKLGGYYHEPPYTDAELADLRRRLYNGGPMTMFIGSRGPSNSPWPSRKPADAPPPAPTTKPLEPEGHDEGEVE